MPRRSGTRNRGPDRQLWIGLPGSSWWAKLGRETAEGLWIFPTPLARDRWLWRQGPSHRLTTDQTLWCWDDLWAWVLGQSESPPSILGAAGARVALDQALSRSLETGELQAVVSLAHAPGFRRRLAHRMAAWTRAERNPEDEPPIDRPVERDEWRIYARYRAVLRDLNADDEAGLPGWASHAMIESHAAGLARFGSIIVIDPPAVRAVHRTVLAMARTKADMRVVLAGELDDQREDVFAESIALRDRLRGRGFRVEWLQGDPRRPAGLDTVERTLFRTDETRLPRLTDPAGLSIVGAPAGEGVGRAVADQVTKALEHGVSPDEVVVLVRNWDEQADEIDRAMRSWGIPTCARRPRPLRTSSVVQALRLAMRLPTNGWDCLELVRLLRHGSLRPSAKGAGDAMTRATAASAVQESRVFRGLDTLLKKLNTTASEPTAPSSENPNDVSGYDRRARKRIPRARVALEVLNWLADLLRRHAVAGTWNDQLEHLIELSRELGLGGDDHPALAELFAALDEQGDVQNRLDNPPASRSWAEFSRDVDALIRETNRIEGSWKPGHVLMATAEEARGISARLVVLGNLAEGTFPTREAARPEPVEAMAEIEATDVDGETESPADDTPVFPSFEGMETHATARRARPTPMGREMLRFLRLLGTARHRLTFVYPTADDKGSRLLPAGFLEEVRWLYADGSLDSVSREQIQLDPTLLEAETRSPAEQRIQAVSRAVLADDDAMIARLWRDPAQQTVFRHIVRAVALNRKRSREVKTFTRFDGKLQDSATVRSIARRFNPNYSFSASQLESLSLCPFQFFLRHVLRLDPVEQRDELDENRAERGNQIHDLLKQLHDPMSLDDEIVGLKMAEATSARLADLLERLIHPDHAPRSDVEAALWRIEAEHARRMLRHYTYQMQIYVNKIGQNARCVRTEYEFDAFTDEGDTRLRLLDGDRQVCLHGKIDRIDVIDSISGPAFRVIDYKTGRGHTQIEVKRGLALQLPLYAMAVERHRTLIPEGRATDVGYWQLGRDGYKQIPLDKLAGGSWEGFQAILTQFILDAVDRLRQGQFPVAPRKRDCQRFCDFVTVCRIHQLRHAEKTWAEAPFMETSP